MMLKTSSRSINPFCGMFKTTVRRNIGIVILLCIGVLLFCPGYILTTSADEIFKSGDYNSLFSDISKAFIIVLSLVGIGTSMLYNLINFMFLYAKRSDDVFEALPLTRTELLFSRILAGFVCSLIPVTLGFVSLGVLNIFVAYPLSFKYLIWAFICLVTYMLLCSAFSLIFVVCAGSAFDLVLSFAVVNIGLFIVGLIVSVIIEELLVGYIANYVVLPQKMSPIINSGVDFFGFVTQMGKAKFSIFYLIKNVLMTAVFGTLSAFLFKYRKSERGGQAYAYRFIYIICCLLASFCGAFALGMIFSNGRFSFVFWALAFVGGMLTAVIYGAVTNRGFKEFKKSLVSGAVSAVILALVALTVSLDIFGFVNRIPQKQDIKSATIIYNGDEIDFDNADFPLDIHKKVVDGKLYKKDSFNTYFIQIDYKLKNGKEFKRGYNIGYESGKNVLKKIICSDERFETMLNNLEKSGASTIDFQYEHNDVYVGSYITPSEFREFISLYCEEIKQAKSIKNLFVYDENREYYYIAFEDKKLWHPYCYDLGINDEFPKTKAYIESLALETRNENLTD